MSTATITTTEVKSRLKAAATAIGEPRMSVLSDRADWPGIGAGMCEGRVVLHDREAFIDYKLYDRDGDYR